MLGKVKNVTFVDREVFKTTATIQELNQSRVQIDKVVTDKYRDGDSSECSVDFDEIEGNFIRTQTPRKAI